MRVQLLLISFSVFIIPACSYTPGLPTEEVLPTAANVAEFGLAELTTLEDLQTSQALEGCISAPIVARKSSNSPDIESAQKALIGFFYHLHAGDYGRAVELYGGEYDLMRQHNPGIDPDDYASLFRNACTINGAQCLEILQVEFLGKPSNAEFQFAVQFENDDGSLFTLGPCCGDEDINAGPKDKFLYTVRLECTGRYLVMGMPVYVP